MSETSSTPEPRPSLILIADDDPDVRVFLEVTLAAAGFEVATAENGEEAVERALERRPGLVLLDVMMPGISGVETCRRLRDNGRTSDVPVILVTAKSEGKDKVEGLTAGADDYVTKPFDPEELVARIRATLRRAEALRALSPLTGLPGNPRIEEELARRVERGEPFALLYADLNDFKAYNDHYGFSRGDRVITALAEILTDVAAALDALDAFVGHVGGDDFVLFVEEPLLAPAAEAVCSRFDALAPALYDEDDRRRGYVEVADRQGTIRRHPIVSVSIGIARSRPRAFDHPSALIAVATEMKHYAKLARRDGSNWAADRRSRERRKS